MQTARADKIKTSPSPMDVLSFCRDHLFFIRTSKEPQKKIVRTIIIFINEVEIQTVGVIESSDAEIREGEKKHVPN